MNVFLIHIKEIINKLSDPNLIKAVMEMNGDEWIERQKKALKGMPFYHYPKKK